MKRNLFFGLVLIVAGFAGGQVFKILRHAQANAAEQGPVADVVEEAIEQTVPADVPDPFGVTAAAPASREASRRDSRLAFPSAAPPPGVDPAMPQVVESNQSQFEHLVSQTHRQLAALLKQIEAESGAAAPREAELLSAMANYVAYSELRQIESDLSELVKRSGGTEAAKKAAAALEALHAAPQEQFVAPKTSVPVDKSSN